MPKYHFYKQHDRSDCRGPFVLFRNEATSTFVRNGKRGYLTESQLFKEKRSALQLIINQHRVP